MMKEAGLMFMIIGAFSASYFVSFEGVLIMAMGMGFILYGLGGC